MSVRTRARFLALAAAFVAARLPAQETKAGTQEAADQEAALVRALAPFDGSRATHAATEAQRLELERALARMPASAAGSTVVQTARVRLGELELHRGAWLAAEAHFRSVLESKTPSTADLRGASRYGEALAKELQGELRLAKGLYEALDREHAGTRYGDWAKAALGRLAAGERGGRAGRRAPHVASRLDVDGKPRDLASLSGAPVLIVFWSPLSAASVDRLVKWQRIWLQSQPKERMLAIAARGDTDQILEARKSQALEVPLLACPGRFLDPVLLDFGVHAVPDAVLIGGDGTVVARDPSPQRLAELLAELRMR